MIVLVVVFMMVGGCGFFSLFHTFAKDQFILSNAVIQGWGQILKKKTATCAVTQQISLHLHPTWFKISCNLL